MQFQTFRGNATPRRDSFGMFAPIKNHGDISNCVGFRLSHEFYYSPYVLARLDPSVNFALSKICEMQAPRNRSFASACLAKIGRFFHDEFNRWHGRVVLRKSFPKSLNSSRKFGIYFWTMLSKDVRHRISDLCTHHSSFSNSL